MLNYNQTFVEKFVKVATNQSENQFSFGLSDDCKSILCVDAQISNLSAICDNKEYKLSGNFIILVTMQTKDDKIVKKQFFEEFNLIQSENSVNINCKIIPTYDIMDIEFIASGGKLQVTIDVETRCIISNREKITALEASENVFLSSNDYSIFNVLTRNEKFYVQDEKQVASIDNIISTNSEVTITNSKIYKDILQIEGELATTLLYEVDERVEKIEYVLPFREEFASLNLAENTPIFASVSACEATAEIEQSPKNITIQIKTDIGITLCIFESEQVKLSCDAFVKDYKSQATVEGLQVLCYANSTIKNENFDAKFDVDAEIENALFFLGNRASITNINQDENKIEGVLSGTVLCTKQEKTTTIIKEIQGDDEVERTVEDSKIVYTIATIQTPFSISVDLSQMSEYLAFAKIYFTSCRLKMRGELEVNYKIIAKIDEFTTNNLCFISNLEITEEIKENSLLSVYFKGENESLFSVAKQLNVDPESLPLDEREIIVFRQ